MSLARAVMTLLTMRVRYTAVLNDFAVAVLWAEYKVYTGIGAVQFRVEFRISPVFGHPLPPPPFLPQIFAIYFETATVYIVRIHPLINQAAVMYGYSHLIVVFQWCIHFRRLISGCWINTPSVLLGFLDLVICPINLVCMKSSDLSVFVLHGHTLYGLCSLA